MELEYKERLNYDDITIVPAISSSIEHRNDCNPYDGEDMLPIFTAPMGSVVSMDNWHSFIDKRINVVIPRTVSLNQRLNSVIQNQSKCIFVAFSISEVTELFVDGVFAEQNPYGCNICIDVANGHMQQVLDIISTLKAKCGPDGIRIMAGNIANPETYGLYEEAGADYVRCGIGGGSACLTSTSTGVHYPYFSLLKEIYERKEAINGKCRIIADGNIRSYGDIQKALIYADYVMIGGLFNKAIESAGRTTYGKFYWNTRWGRIVRPLKSLIMYGKEIPTHKYPQVMNRIKQGKMEAWKEHYGMSTKKAQSIMGDKKKFKTAEGRITKQKVEYDIKGWAENETDYLRSAMSYTNSYNLSEYKETEWVRITNPRINK